MINKYETSIPGNQNITFEQFSLIINSQRLWQHLVFWTRALIITTLRDPVRQEANFKRLYTGVTRDFYNYFRLLYGPEVAQSVIDIISGTLVNVLYLIEGIKENNVGVINSNTIQLYQRADFFSAYLNKLNRYWDESQWKNYLYQYIKLAIDQIVAMKSQNFDAEIAIAGRIEDIASSMGTYMAEGVIKSLSNQKTSSANSTPE